MHDEYRPTFGAFGVENENRLGRRLYFFGVAVFRVLVLGVLVIPRLSSKIGSSPIGLKCRIFSMISLKVHYFSKNRPNFTFFRFVENSNKR